MKHGDNVFLIVAGQFIRAVLQIGCERSDIQSLSGPDVGCGIARTMNADSKAE